MQNPNGLMGSMMDVRTHNLTPFPSLVALLNDRIELWSRDAILVDLPAQHLLTTGLMDVLKAFLREPAIDDCCLGGLLGFEITIQREIGIFLHPFFLVFFWFFKPFFLIFLLSPFSHKFLVVRGFSRNGGCGNYSHRRLHQRQNRPHERRAFVGEDNSDSLRGQFPRQLFLPFSR